MEKQYHNGQNRAQLNDDIEHFQKFRRYIQREEFLGQNHVSSAGNRQPLGNPLDDTDDNHLQ